MDIKRKIPLANVGAQRIVNDISRGPGEEQGETEMKVVTASGRNSGDHDANGGFHYSSI